LLKPNISAIVGDLYPEGGARRDAGFRFFTWASTSARSSGQIVTGFLGETIGWHWGFGAAGAGMLIGLFVFATRSRTTLGDIGIHPTRNPDAGCRRVRSAV
jgi:POT family proton-dependent oligopeptide transporter